MLTFFPKCNVHDLAEPAFTRSHYFQLLEILTNNFCHKMRTNDHGEAEPKIADTAEVIFFSHLYALTTLR